MKSQFGGNVQSKAYKNGSPGSPEKDTNSGVYQSYDFDLGACAINDLIQIYGKCAATPGELCICTLQKLCYDRGLTVIGGVTLDETLLAGAFSVTNQDPV